MKSQFLPDEPIVKTTDDRLNFRDYVSKIRRSIERTQPPFVFGLLGGWGNGKTSILRMLENELREKPGFRNKHFIPILFEAWKYENEQNIIYPLLHRIRKSYEHKLEADSQSQTFRNAFLKVATTSGLVLTDTVLRFATKRFIGEAVSLEDLQKQLENVTSEMKGYEEVLSQWTNQFDELETAYAELLNSYADDLSKKPNIDRTREDICFVILIDDLDRCLPDTTIKVLESIKNYLRADNCIYVLALNPTVVYQGIKTKYKGLEINGREYLEKILNYSFYVPQPSEEAIRLYAINSLKGLVLNHREENISQYFREFGVVVSECNFTNPRKIKRILNHFLFFLQEHTQLDGFHLPNIVRFIILSEYYPEIFQLFVHSGEEALQKFKMIGGSDFKIDQFEKDQGISITSIYFELAQMRSIFTGLETGPQQKSLKKHADAVYKIVHLS